METINAIENHPRRSGWTLARSRFGWLLIGLTLSISAMTQNLESPGIHVSGRGEVRIEPDIARFSLQVTRQGRDAAALKKELDSITAKIIKLASKHKIKRKDVIAASVQINPNRVYENKRQRIDGVIASRSIQIVLRDLTQIGDFMNASLEVGINDIGGVQLDTSRRIELEAEALELAIADSIAMANKVAKAYGVAVLGVQDVRVSGNHAVEPRLMRSMKMADSDESFSPGEMAINRSVEASFAIGGQ